MAGTRDIFVIICVKAWIRSKFPNDKISLNTMQKLYKIKPELCNCTSVDEEEEEESKRQAE